MRLRVKQARPANLNDAIRHAVELEAFQRAEQKCSESQGFIRNVNNVDDLQDIRKSMGELKSSIIALQEAMKNRPRYSENADQQRGNLRPREEYVHSRKLTNETQNPRVRDDRIIANRNKRKLICYDCGEEGHVRTKHPRMSIHLEITVLDYL